MDFLEATRAQIDFYSCIVTFYDDLTATDLTTCRPPLNIIFSRKPIVVKPHSEVIVSISLPKHLYNHLCLIQSLQNRAGQKFLCARSLVRAKPGYTTCKILNPTEDVIWLSKRRPLASIEQVDGYHIFDAPGISSQPSDSAIASCSAILPHSSFASSSAALSDSFRRQSDVHSSYTQSTHASPPTTFHRHTDSHIKFPMSHPQRQLDPLCKLFHSMSNCPF